MSEAVETTELFGPDGRMIVNSSDVAQWQAKGYKTAEQIAQAKSQKVTAETQTAAEPTAKLTKARRPSPTDKE